MASTLVGIFWISIFLLAVIASNIRMRMVGIGPWFKVHFYTRNRPIRSMGLLVVFILFVCCALVHVFAAIFGAPV